MSIERPTENNAPAVAISGLPASLPAGAVTTLADGGRSLVIAAGNRLTVYRLDGAETGVRAEEAQAIDLPGCAFAVEELSLGVVVAVQAEQHALVAWVRERELVVVHRSPGTVTSFAAGGSHAYLVVQDAEPGRGRLLQVDIRQRAVSASRALDHARMALAVDRGGQHVVVTDAIARTVAPLDERLRPVPLRLFVPQSNVRDELQVGPLATHPRDCCCFCCKPQVDDGRGADGASDGADRPAVPGREPTGHDGTPPHYDGVAGIPDDNGGTIVSDGGRVDRHPLGGRSTLPCGNSVFFGVATLRNIGGYILAADRNARHVVLLSADMNLVDEWDLGRGGAVLATTRASPAFAMHMRSSGEWLLHDAHLTVAKSRPWLGLFPLAPPESKIFIGQQTYTMSYGQPDTPDHITALLLPVIEGDQNFSSADLHGFGEFVKRTTAPAIKDYYHENSFGALTNVTVTVFGAGKGPAGGPLKLPRRRLAHYFHPSYVAAAVELVKNGVNMTSRIVFDGRESLRIEVKPLDGGGDATQLELPFFALGFKVQQNLYPVTLKFVGNEKLKLQVTLPDGAAKTLQLKFTPSDLNIPNEAAVADDTAFDIALAPLLTYLDGVMQSAEAVAGLATRVFAPPKAHRVRLISHQFGRLLVTFGSATPAGNKLAVTDAVASHPGGDPMGLAAPMLGSVRVWDNAALQEIVDSAALIAQNNAKVAFNLRILNSSGAVFEPGASRLTTVLPVADLIGGPGATVKFLSSSGLEGWFDTSSSRANSSSTKNSSQALRDDVALFEDAFSAAIDALRAAKEPVDSLKEFSVILVMPLEPAAPGATLPGEAWNVSALDRPFEFRGAERITTVIDRKDKGVALYGAWALVLMAGGVPDVPLICHEIGHGLKFGDLYYQDGYRDELAYMGDWALMDDHHKAPHHGGYHKLQAGWIPDGAGTPDDYGRVYPIALPDAAKVLEREVLLVPLELWRDSLVASSWAAFSVPAGFPVVQLARIDLGGDGSVFGLIEARQRGVKFGHCLPNGIGGCLAPAVVGGVLISNCISWSRDGRFALADQYRRQVQLLNPNNFLSAAGQQFDLAFAPELAVKGLKVELVAIKLVEGDAQVFRVKITRENAAFADVFIESGEPYWKSPDVWVDWTGDNGPNGNVPSLDKKDHHRFPLGQPTGQGEDLRVHPAESGKAEKHWIVARIRNRGTVKAVDIEMQFFYYKPQGGGDGGNPMELRNMARYTRVDSVVEEIVGRDDLSYAPKDVLVNWTLPAGFSGHTCLYVHIKDSRVERDSGGAILGTADIWGRNNYGQKNVSIYEFRGDSPFAPVEFDFSVHNAGIGPELAYIEPDNLPYGMQLTVTPPRQTIASGKTAIFHCKLELDERIIRTGCENDRRFHILAWRADPESSARWGGVEYEIRPRKSAQVQLTGSWDASNEVVLHGTVTPPPGGGLVRIRLDFPSMQATWTTVDCTPIGQFQWKGQAPAGDLSVGAVAVFEGNRKFASARSDDLELKAPPAIR